MDTITETKLFSCFRAHYGFRIRFCNPHAGHEKGNVENKVGTSRRNLFVPVPTYHDIEEFNRSLLDQHKKKAEENHYKKGTEIAQLFEEDKKHFLPLPTKPFNVCRYETYRADGYGKVCVDAKTLLLAYALTTLMFWNRTETFLSVICASTEQHART